MIKTRPVVDRNTVWRCVDNKEQAWMRAEHNGYLVLIGRWVGINDPSAEGSPELSPSGGQRYLTE